MKVRALPPLQPLCERHNHVVLLWDERIEGRALLGVGAQRSILVDTPRSGDWALWEAFIQESESRAAWSFGWLGYDLHDSLDLAAKSECPSPVPAHPSAWPLMHWWQPEVVLEWAPGQETPVVVAGADTTMASEITTLLDAAYESTRSDSGTSSKSWRPLTPSWSREEYEAKFNAVKTALQRGDIYEMNLCMPWSGAAPADESWGMFERLAANTKAPHSAYVQAGPWRTLCASPERFLAKRGNTLHSQPIKGTVKRGATEAEDNALRDALARSEKEQAENVMIVDLVRNDLSRVAERDSVNVDELFGIHSFATVHQMISSVSCTLRPDASPLDIMRSTFPMGSMTGAPKLSAMKHIARLEETGRGLYSGALGYVCPNGDWDLNVVIRSLMHHAETGRVDATFGGAITLLAEAEAEYDECLLKAKALRNCLEP
jgi:para-aminobenzoate synthetase component 1